MAEALVASEKVGEGGPEEVCRRLGEIASERKERAEGIGRCALAGVFVVGYRPGKWWWRVIEGIYPGTRFRLCEPGKLMRSSGKAHAPYMETLGAALLARGFGA
jgi:hypothetical protein